MILECKNLTKAYHGFPALSDISLQIEEGHIIGLLGPNGSGKTTLIKLIAGLLSPSSGTISIEGNPVGPASKNLISYLPDHFYLDGHRKVKDIIGFFHDFYRDFEPLRAYDMLGKLNIDPNQKLKTFSKGTKEKVHLILAMSRRAKLYLLDEPIAGAKDTGHVPTLTTLREKLLDQPEPEAKQIALSLELYTTGSLDIFGKQSNVDLEKRIVVFDIHDLGTQLKPAGLLVITDTMLNRVTLNWRRGKRTHVFIDEFHVVFENEFSAAFFNSAWRQFRKRNAFPTAITQNVEYLLDSVQASTMLSNSEFIVMLNQAASDREKLAKLLNISMEQMSYITNADAGCGLIKYGSALVPFINRFPQDTKLYQLMTTKPGEGRFALGEE